MSAPTSPPASTSPEAGGRTCECGTGCGRRATPGPVVLSHACYQRWRRVGFPRQGTAPKVPPARDRPAESRDLRARFAALRRAGVPVRAAAERLAVHPETGRRWDVLRKRGALLPEES